MKVLNLKPNAEQLLWWYEEKNGLSGPGWWWDAAAVAVASLSLLLRGSWWRAILHRLVAPNPPAAHIRIRFRAIPPQI